jgi:transposase-like protein
MSSRDKITYRYSLAFKQKVVSEVESGKYYVAQARRVYGLGAGRIEEWMRQLGKNHLLGKVVRIEMKDEKDRIKELEKQKRELESALAQEHLRNLALESLIEVAGEHYQVDIKKNFGSREFKNLSRKSKRKN